MLRSRRTSYLLGAATLWLPLYLAVFLVLVLALVMSQRDAGPGDGLPSLFVVLIVLHVLTILLSFGLLAVYLVDVFKNPDLADKQDLRIVWVLLVIFLSGFAMVVYWWLYLRPGGEAFGRRQPA